MNIKSKNILKILLSALMCFLIIFAPQNQQFANAKRRSSKSKTSSSSKSKTSSSSKSTSTNNSSSSKVGNTSYSNNTYFFYFAPNCHLNSGYLRHTHKSYRIYLDVARDSESSTNNTNLIITTDNPDISLSNAEVKVNGKSLGTFSRKDRSEIDITNLTIKSGSKVEVIVTFEDYYWFFGRFSNKKKCTFNVGISDKS